VETICIAAIHNCAKKYLALPGQAGGELARVCGYRAIRFCQNIPSGMVTMLQTYNPAQQTAFVEEPGRDAGLEHYFAIAKRRVFYWLIPFILVFVLASLIVAIQRPVYQAEGKILVETQDIPSDLVKSTVTDTANQRIQVIQQRITTRDNLLEIVKKFGLFPGELQWMTASQVLDLMKERTQLKLVDLSLPSQQSSLAIAFTLSFDYENPVIAARVANEFLTLILAEDARNRTNRAAETSKFLEQEVKRLQGVLASTEMQITEASLKPQDPIKEVPLQLQQQREELTKLKMDLVDKSAVYSSGHPAVITLKKRIAALEKIIAEVPDQEAHQTVAQTNNGIDALRQQLAATGVALDDANRKLSAARLGESLERNQQSERLQVIEQPIVPQRPFKPNRPKLLALAFALAVMAGFGTVFAAETLDKSIHSSQELASVVDGRLIVAIPYIATLAEGRRRKYKFVWLLVIVAVLGLGAVGAALYIGLSIDLSWIDRSWLDRATHLFK
jgi:uncharacterized protein involved in exopolysaccharide biosynthesis